jgi:hypothetical protein
MGVWGTALFSDDVACDVRDYYRELIEDGVEDETASRLTAEKFRAYLEEPDGVALLAFAVTQSKVGRLDADIRDRALAVIDRGADLEVWKRENPKLLPKRRAVLEQARAQLTGQQPPRKRLRPPKRTSAGLTAGDVLVLELPQRVTVLRVVRVHSHRRGETPIIEELDFEGTEPPSREVLERLAPKRNDPVAFHPLSPDARFFTFVMQGIDWQHAGFRKIEPLSARAGDDEARVPLSGISWETLAGRYRRRSAGE